MGYATLDLTACEGTLSVNGVLLHSQCVMALDLSALADDGDVRGSDIVVPGADGVLSRPRRYTATRKDCVFLIVGGVNSAGVPNADPAQGLIDNWTALRDGVGTGDQTGDGTVTAVWTQPDAGTLSAAVTVLGFRRGPSRPGYHCKAVLSLLVPGGVFG